MKRDIHELYKIIDARLDGKRADWHTLDTLFPDEKSMKQELTGFSQDQILQAVVKYGLRSGYCAWRQDMIRPNGEWIPIPKLYARLIQRGKYDPHNQGICPSCQDEQTREFLNANSFE